MRPIATILAAVGLAALVVVGLSQAGGGSDAPPKPAATAGGRFDLSRARDRLQGAPGPLAALHQQSNELLGGGRAAFTQRLRGLAGHPVVVNKWASWCGPCRSEFPYFQEVATERGKEIAFVGLNSKDKRPAAAGFLDEYPVPYPSYEDPDEEIARAIRAPANYPITLFLDERGRTAFVHQGGYRSQADLAADIDRHLR